MKAAAHVGAAATGDQASTLAEGDIDLGCHLVQAGGVDQRPHLHASISLGVAIAGGGHGAADTLDEVLGHRALHIDALGAVAHLAGVDNARIADGAYRQVQVGIGQDDGRRLAA